MMIQATSPDTIALATIDAIQAAYDAPCRVVDVIYGGRVVASYKSDVEGRLAVLDHRIGCRPMAFDWTDVRDVLTAAGDAR